MVSEPLQVPSQPGEGSRFLTPYVPRLVIDWLHEQPEVPYRAIDGTGVFADISGFTNLTERLARRGRAGAEEMGDVLNLVFEQLLSAAYEFGAGLVKWGGDAVFLLYDGPEHAARACRSALEMQAVIAKAGRVETSSGVVRLRISIGIHSGLLDFLLVGNRFRELIVTGPAATAVAQMEKAAEATEIVVSPATADQLGAAGYQRPDRTKGGGLLLTVAPDVARWPNRDSVVPSIDLSVAFSAPLRDHLLSGTVENEHRSVTVAFLEFFRCGQPSGHQGSCCAHRCGVTFRQRLPGRRHRQRGHHPVVRHLRGRRQDHPALRGASEHG